MPSLAVDVNERTGRSTTGFSVTVGRIPTLRQVVYPVADTPVTGVTRTYILRRLRRRHLAHDVGLPR
jgi:hypothetical protein